MLTAFGRGAEHRPQACFPDDDGAPGRPPSISLPTSAMSGLLSHISAISAILCGKKLNQLGGSIHAHQAISPRMAINPTIPPNNDARRAGESGFSTEYVSRRMP